MMKPVHTSPPLVGYVRVTPYHLFNLVVDALTAILDAAKHAGHIRGICPYLIRVGGITNLGYADDTILMVEGSDTDIRNIKFLLLCFQEMLGLPINFTKSEVMVLGYSDMDTLVENGAKVTGQFSH